MSFDKRNGLKLAGVVLSGTLVLGSYVPVAAAPAIGAPEEKSVQQSEEKTEKIVFLNTEKADKKQNSEEKEKKSFDDQAVHSFEEALAAFKEDASEEESGKLILEKKEVKKLLILCGETALSDEEKKQAEELDITCMTDTEYEEILKAREEAEKAEAEKAESGNAEAELPVIELPSSPEEPPVLLWQAPEFSAPAEEEELQDTTVAEENTGILLPGFTAPVMEEAPQEDGEEELPEETDASEENPELQETVPAEEETEEVFEEIQSEEETVVDLFAIFNSEAETASIDTEAAELQAAGEAEVEDTVTKPALMALPGMDLVGSGTSGVGGGNKPSTPARPSGNGSQNTPAAPSQPSAPTHTSTPVKPPAQPVTPVKPSGSANVVQTGDASNRSLWGLSALFSGAMAAHFALQWKRLMKSEK